jgi:Dolichyl-phosphate-mannose-protein mannosyltransferase
VEDSTDKLNNFSAIIGRILGGKNSVWYLLLFAFLCRLAVALSVDPLGSDTVDGFDYHNHAIAILNGQDYPMHGSLPFMRPPLYPILLSLVYFFVPHDSYIAARVVNGILDTAACFIFYKLIMLVWDSRTVALLSTLIYAINPLVLFFTARVRAESLFTLLLVCFVYLCARCGKQRSANAGWFFAAGALIGLAALTRPNALILIALVPCWLIYVYFQQKQKLAAMITFFILGCCITILPWTARNYFRYGELILINDAAGYNFWISNSELKAEDMRSTNNQQYTEADNHLWRETAAVEETLAGRSLTERQKYYMSLGFEYIETNFSSWLWLTAGKFLEFWSPMVRIDMQGKKAVLTLPFGILMLVGAVFFCGKLTDPSFDRSTWLLFAILIFSSTVSGVLNWSSVRYRVPMIDAYLIPFGINWIAGKKLAPAKV